MFNIFSNIDNIIYFQRTAYSYTCYTYKFKTLPLINNKTAIISNNILINNKIILKIIKSIFIEF